MSSSHNFALRRTEDNLAKLHKEQEKLTHNLRRLRHDEEYELDRLRREYRARIHLNESRQAEIIDELKKEQRELERIQKEILEEKEEAAQEKERTGRRSRGTRLFR